VELVFIEKSLHSEEGIRVAATFSDQYPCALVGEAGRDGVISQAVENWLAELA
jgi:hypothetical protein